MSPHQSCHRGLTLLREGKHMWYFLTPTDGGSSGGLSMAEYFMNQTHYFCGSPAYVLEDLTMPGQMGMKISLLVMTSASYTCCWFQSLWRWAIFMRHKYIYTLSIISQVCNGAGSWNPSSWSTRTSLPYMVNNIAADDLAMQSPHASTVIVLTL